MSVDHSRRALLKGTTAAICLCVAGTAILRSGLASAQSGTKPSQRRLLAITYPAGPSIRFDANYYRDHHAKLFMDIYGESIERFELRSIASSQAGKFSALINVWIADFDLFHARSTPAAYQRMGDDKKHFTNTSSAVELDEVTYEVGEPRSSIPRGCGCASLLYPSGPAGAWGDNAKCREYVEGLTRLLGKEAIRRIELRKGIELLDDGSPAYQGGINVYARNSATFWQAWSRNREAASKLSMQLCSVAPLELNTTVFSIESGIAKT
jgi:hypothetical protein